MNPAPGSGKMKEQMSLFSWMLKNQGDQEPEQKASKTREPRKFVPEVTIAYSGLRALILVKTGEHLERFRLHTKIMQVDEFRKQAYLFAREMVGLFVRDEKFEARMAAERGFDRPIREPLFVNAGKLHEQAVHELGSQAWPW